MNNNGESIKKYNELLIKYLNDLVEGISPKKDINARLIEDIVIRFKKQLAQKNLDISSDGVKTLISNAFIQYINILKNHFDHSNIHRIDIELSNSPELTNEFNTVTSNLATAVNNINKIPEYINLVNKVKETLLTYFKQTYPNHDDIEFVSEQIINDCIGSIFSNLTKDRIDEFVKLTLPTLYSIGDNVTYIENKEPDIADASKIVEERDQFIRETMDLEIHEGLENGVVTISITDPTGKTDKYFGTDAMERLTSYNQLFEASRPGKKVDVSHWANSVERNIFDDSNNINNDYHNDDAKANTDDTVNSNVNPIPNDMNNIPMGKPVSINVNPSGMNNDYHADNTNSKANTDDTVNSNVNPIPNDMNNIPMGKPVSINVNPGGMNNDYHDYNTNSKANTDDTVNNNVNPIPNDMNNIPMGKPVSINVSPSGMNNDYHDYNTNSKANTDDIINNNTPNNMNNIPMGKPVSINVNPGGMNNDYHDYNTNSKANTDDIINNNTPNNMNNIPMGKPVSINVNPSGMNNDYHDYNTNSKANTNDTANNNVNPIPNNMNNIPINNSGNMKVNPTPNFTNMNDITINNPGSINANPNNFRFNHGSNANSIDEGNEEVKKMIFSNGFTVEEVKPITNDIDINKLANLKDEDTNVLGFNINKLNFSADDIKTVVSNKEFINTTDSNNLHSLNNNQVQIQLDNKTQHSDSDDLKKIRSMMGIGDEEVSKLRFGSDLSFVPNFRNPNEERDLFIKKVTGIIIEEDLDNKGLLYLKVIEPSGREQIYTGKDAVNMIINFNRAYLEANPDKTVDTSLIDNFNNN